MFLQGAGFQISTNQENVRLNAIPTHPQTIETLQCNILPNKRTEGSYKKVAWTKKKRVPQLMIKRRGQGNTSNKHHPVYFNHFLLNFLEFPVFPCTKL